MKVADIFLFILISLTVLTITGCSRKIYVSNKVFIDKDSLTLHRLEFLNDSICIYDQKFLCEIKSPYNKIQIKCKYHLDGKKLILENLTYNKDTLSKTCFEIPEDAFINCDPITKEFEGKSQMEINKGIKLIDMYRYQNNITIDTLTYIRGKLEIVKIIDCAPFALLRKYNFKEEKYKKP